LLHDDLHWEKFNRCYVPHSLEADQKRSRVELSREPLQILEQDQQYVFEYRLTGDESWFFLKIFIIRAEPQIQMTDLKFQDKKFNPKAPHFNYLGQHRDHKSVVCSERHDM
jgi:hypothetical protein